MKAPSPSAYKPPYTLSGKAMDMIAEIAAAVERYRIRLEGPDGLRLRKANHVRTLRGTTAIEGNTLTEDQITAILAGKRVLAPAREIAEIRGAHAAYSAIETFDPLSLDDLLKAHGMMAEGLVARPGKWRNVNVGVVDAFGTVIHMAPPFSNVPQLMADLFAWLRTDDAPMLVKSCVFHYEFEFIHPFPDGNGRTGRLWQTILLGSWRRELLSAPVENIVWSHQQEYYRAIRESTARTDSTPVPSSTSCSTKSSGLSPHGARPPPELPRKLPRKLQRKQPGAPSPPPPANRKTPTKSSPLSGPCRT